MTLVGTTIPIILRLGLVVHTIGVGINAWMDSLIVLMRKLRGEMRGLTVRITVELGVVLSRSLALCRPVGLEEDMEGVAAEGAAVAEGEEEAAVEAVGEEEEGVVVVVDMFII